MKKALMFVVFLAALSCHKEAVPVNTCQTKNPLTDLSWLQNTVAYYERSQTGGELTITQALYQGQTVFAVNFFLGIDASTWSLYRCDGSLICQSNVTIAGLNGNCGNIDQELTNSVVIYKKP